MLTVAMLAAVLTVAVKLSAVTVPARQVVAPAADRRRAVARWPIGHRIRAMLPARRLTDDDVADWCEGIARQVRAGDSLSAAITSTDASLHTRQFIEPALLAIRRGTEVAIAVLAIRGVTPGLDHAVGVLRVCAAAGGPAAAPLDRTASTLRDRSAAMAERRAQSAQARLSATVLTILPGGVLALLVAVSPSTRGALTGPIGLICLPAGAGLNLAGWHWMRSLLRSEP